VGFGRLRVGQHVNAVEDGRAALRPQQPFEDGQQRRLARAVGAEQAEDFAALDGQ
jgi:hypothetical protein